MIFAGKRRKIQVFCIMVVAAVIFTGCSKRGDTKEESEYKKIIVGSDRYEPYVYRDDDGKFTGVDVEIAKKALNKMGYEPEFKEITWEKKKEYLNSGEVDCLWGCFSMNGRENEYKWAGPYLYSSQSVVVRTGSNIQKVSDLAGKKVAVKESTKAEEYLLYPASDKVPDVGQVYAFSNMNEVYASLRKNYVDAICGHESALNVLVKSAPSEYRILNESLFSSKVGVAFAKDYPSGFVDELSRTLEKIRKDGTAAEILKKYGLNVEKSLMGVTKQ
ncbi:ABC transporter substrate-binding protein [Eubacterium sp. MSJ-13]|uniref:substrate-binding periplasmic protein n=1 Tax=Eubacterium sp. MSJ-13 TaxID=2841513 RepID=UPI001C10C843|nr:ABC transporter substrate-binding protein [Eubacterium sp. MSJ-13]MBU5478401.1 ABC transporter substrate-binding protein [Eubacterium sp. MSJ-13]